MMESCSHVSSLVKPELLVLLLHTLMLRLNRQTNNAVYTYVLYEYMTVHVVFMFFYVQVHAHTCIYMF